MTRVPVVTSVAMPPPPPRDCATTPCALLPAVRRMPSTASCTVDPPNAALAELVKKREKREIDDDEFDRQKAELMRQYLES